MPTTFGRRASPQASIPAPRTSTVHAPVMAETKPAEPPVFESTAPSIDTLSLEDELREWKRNRKSGFQIPWRQISLMATLCFGIASLVLPDSTNEAVNWLLYALMAISFVAGISRRGKRGETANPA